MVHVVAIVLAFSATATLSAPRATAVATSYVRFWGPSVPPGGFYPECYEQSADVSRGATIMAWGNTRARFSNGGTCNNALSRAQNWLANRPDLIGKQCTNCGVVACSLAPLTWGYNAVPTDAIGIGYANAFCPATYQFAGKSQGRFFQSNTGTFFTSGFTTQSIWQ
jgi:hypothetical protein